MTPPIGDAVLSAAVMAAVPSYARSLVRSFVDGLQDILGNDLIGIYLYGAMTFADSDSQIQDLDYHVIVREPLDGGQRDAIDRLHHDLTRDYPPLGAEMDGYYVTLDAAQHTAPPRTQMWPLRRLPEDAAWALHCAHIRSGHCIVLAGPDPHEIYPEPSWPELEAALYSEIRFVDDHLPDYPAYCVLNACRLFYSFATRNVVASKRQRVVDGHQARPTRARPHQRDRCYSVIVG